MNNVEFSNLFDVLYNNVTSNQAPGLNEYEKSVFLTKALDEVLKNYFNPKSNPKQEGFDDTIKRQADFSGLMRENSGVIDNSPVSQFDPRSIVYKVPTDVYLIINEQLLLKEENDTKGIRLILPINYDEYRRLMSKPYKEPLKYQAWRLFTSTESNSFNGLRIAEIITTSTDKNSSYTKDYKIRYIKFPKPIILSDFSGSFGEDISINGYNGSEAEYSKSGIHDSKYDAWVAKKVSSNYDIYDQAAISYDINDLNGEAEEGGAWSIASSGEDGTLNPTISSSPSTNNTYSETYNILYKYLSKILVSKNDLVELQTIGGTVYRAWALTDELGNILNGASAKIIATKEKYTFVVELDGYLYVNCRVSNLEDNNDFYVTIKKVKEDVDTDFMSWLEENHSSDILNFNNYIQDYNNWLVTEYPDLYSNSQTLARSIWDPCELDPVIHEEILQRAVELAKVAWTGDVNTIIQTGLRSE